MHSRCKNEWVKPFKNFGGDKINPESVNTILSQKPRTSSENIQSIIKLAVQIFRDVITWKMQF